MMNSYRWIAIVVACLGLMVGAASCGDDDDSAGAPSEDAVEVAERWGEAWQSGDNDAARALYTSVSEDAHMVDSIFRAVWTDLDRAIEQINSRDYDRFELVRVEEVAGFVVAEYEVGTGPDDFTVVAVFILGGEDDSPAIVSSNIYFTGFGGPFKSEGFDYPESENEDGWVILD